MPLTIEDGSNVAGANSYATRQQIIDYAAARGVAINDDATTDVLAIAAMDYLESKDFKGDPTYGIVGVDQALEWPRQSVTIGESSMVDQFSGATSFSAIFLPDNTIPPALVNAQCELALQKFNGVDLMPTRAAGATIKSEKLDVIETEYFENSNYVTPFLPRVEALLKPLLNVGKGSLFALRV